MTKINLSHVRALAAQLDVDLDVASYEKVIVATAPPGTVFVGQDLHSLVACWGSPGSRSDSHKRSAALVDLYSRMSGGVEPCGLKAAGVCDHCGGGPTDAQIDAMRAESSTACCCPLVWGGHGDPKPDPKNPDPECPVHRSEVQDLGVS